MLSDLRRLVLLFWPSGTNWTEVRNAIVVVAVQLRAVAAATDFTDHDDGLVDRWIAELEGLGISVPEPEESLGLLYELGGLFGGLSYLADELWPGNAVSDLLGRLALGLQAASGVKAHEPIDCPESA